jgi:hypothetical protein
LNRNFPGIHPKTYCWGVTQFDTKGGYTKKAQIIPGSQQLRKHLLAGTILHLNPAVIARRHN